MGLRSKNTNTSTSKKLVVHKETLRRLQLRALSEEELRVAVGGEPTGGGTQAPSHCRC